MQFKLILAALKPDYTDDVVEAAKECGVSGATILTGRGTGIHEAKTFLGLTLDTQTDVVFFLVEEHLVEPVMQAIQKAGQFEKPGTGIAFVLPVEQVAGLKDDIVRRTPG